MVGEKVAERTLTDLMADLWDSGGQECPPEVVAGAYFGIRVALVNPVYAATLATLFADELEEPWGATLELAMRAIIAQHPIQEGIRT